MFKNFIIIFQFFLLCSLMIQKPENAKLIIRDLATSKEMVVVGVEYLKKEFNREFSVVDETESIGPRKSKIVESPLELLEQLDELSQKEIINEETWFNEK